MHFCSCCKEVWSIETLRSTLAECPRTPRSTLEAPIQPSAMLVLAQLLLNCSLLLTTAQLLNCSTAAQLFTAAHCCSTVHCCSTAQLFTAQLLNCSLLFLVLLFSVWSKGSYTYNPVSELHLLLVRIQWSIRRRCPKRRGMRDSTLQCTYMEVGDVQGEGSSVQGGDVQGGRKQCTRRCVRRCARRCARRGC